MLYNCKSDTPFILIFVLSINELWCCHWNQQHDCKHFPPFPLIFYFLLNNVVDFFVGVGSSRSCIIGSVIYRFIWFNNQVIVRRRFIHLWWSSMLSQGLHKYGWLSYRWVICHSILKIYTLKRSIVLNKFTYFRDTLCSLSIKLFSKSSTKICKITRYTTFLVSVLYIFLNCMILKYICRSPTVSVKKLKQKPQHTLFVLLAPKYLWLDLFCRAFDRLNKTKSFMEWSIKSSVIDKTENRQ